MALRDIKGPLLKRHDTWPTGDTYPEARQSHDATCRAAVGALLEGHLDEAYSLAWGSVADERHIHELLIRGS